jgi:hypothetical protein
MAPYFFFRPASHGAIDTLKKKMRAAKPGKFSHAHWTASTQKKYIAWRRNRDTFFFFVDEAAERAAARADPYIREGRGIMAQWRRVVCKREKKRKSDMAILNGSDVAHAARCSCSVVFHD